MPPFVATDLPDDELALILDFLEAQPKPTDGEGLYQRFCLNCHGAAGNDGRVFENIGGAPSFEVNDMARGGHHSTSVSDSEFMPAFSTTLITDDELALIAAYVGTL
jgi:mono/diheme cytochrome c family protein